MVVAGPIVRRALLLRDGVPVSGTSGGKIVETLRFRMLADVFDVWPLSGPPTHYRIGNRRPIGWVAAGDVLPWDTRLVVRQSKNKYPTDAFADAPRPVLAWSGETLRVAAWERDRPWSGIAEVNGVQSADVPESSRGVLLSREELLTLLRGASSESDPKTLRLRAILGRLADDRPFDAADLDAARRALPAFAFAGEGRPAVEVSEGLARINEAWKADASWAGLSFMAVPIEALP